MPFFVVKRMRRIRLPPSFFGRKLRDAVTHQLLVEVEGQLMGSLGYVIAIVHLMDPFPDGMLVDEREGCAEFCVTYQAVVFRPFKNEIVDGIVTMVTAHGLFTQVGPLMVFVSHYNLPAGMKYEMNRNAWLPSAAGEFEVMKKDSLVRMRILGVRFEMKETSAIGSMNADYLGLIE